MKILRLLALFTFFFVPHVFGQVKPFVGLGMAVNGEGYSAVGLTGTAGLDVETAHFVAVSSTVYNTSHKTNDGEVRNEKGHVIDGSQEAFGKWRGWLVGGGLLWTKTITSDYAKEATYPLVGAGRDFGGFRVTALYEQSENNITHYPAPVEFTAAGGRGGYASETCKCSSGLRGVKTELWIPSPASAHHLLFHADLDVYSFHASLTDPNNAVLTRSQMANRSISGSLNYAILWRF